MRPFVLQRDIIDVCCDLPFVAEGVPPSAFLEKERISNRHLPASIVKAEES